MTTHFAKRTAVLAVGTILAPAAPTAAQSIGVTSISIGDPLGKPPAQQERVLRVGIDLQAGELVTTGAEDHCHLLFLDGTALTVGPQARLTLDKFVYDKDHKLGALSLSAAQGTFRLVGGRISKTVPITVTTPGWQVTSVAGHLPSMPIAAPRAGPIQGGPPPRSMDHPMGPPGAIPGLPPAMAPFPAPPPGPQ